MISGWVGPIKGEARAQARVAMVPEFTTRKDPNPVVTFGKVLPKFSALSTGSANPEPQRVFSGPWAAERKGSDQIPPLGPAVPEASAVFVLQHNPKEVCTI